MPTIIAIDVWQWTPFVTLIMLAGLMSLPRSPFEAATMDGAGPWRQFVDIMLPLLRPIIALVLLLRGIDAFKEFDKVFIMTGGGPGTRLGAAVDLRLPREFQKLGPRLRGRSRVHGLSGRAHPVLGLLQGRLLEAAGSSGHSAMDRVLEDPRDRHSHLRAGHRADTLSLDGARILQGPSRHLSPQPTWFFTPTLANYPAVFIDKDYWPLVVQFAGHRAGTTVLSILIGAPAAYVFARMDFPGKEDLFFFFLTTRMAPPISIAVPLFLFFTTLGLIDTIYAVVIAHTTFNLSLVVWMMRGFFAEIPKEIDEAAVMDGRSRLGAFVPSSSRSQHPASRPRRCSASSCPGTNSSTPSSSWPSRAGR